MPSERQQGELGVVGVHHVAQDARDAHLDPADAVGRHERAADAAPAHVGLHQQSVAVALAGPGAHGDDVLLRVHGARGEPGAAHGPAVLVADGHRPEVAAAERSRVSPGRGQVGEGRRVRRRDRPDGDPLDLRGASQRGHGVRIDPQHEEPLAARQVAPQGRQAAGRAVAETGGRGAAARPPAREARATIGALARWSRQRCLRWRSRTPPANHGGGGRDLRAHELFTGAARRRARRAGSSGTRRRAAGRGRPRPRRAAGAGAMSGPR